MAPMALEGLLDFHRRYEASLNVADVFLKCLDIVEYIGKVFGKSQNFVFFS